MASRLLWPENNNRREGEKKYIYISQHERQEVKRFFTDELAEE